MEGLLCVGTWGLTVLAVAGGTAVAGLGALRRSRGRWGRRVQVHDRPNGPYRSDRPRDGVPRRAPLLAWIDAVIAPIWATVTLLVFCPLGGLFVLTGGTATCADSYPGPACERSIVHVGVTVAAAVVTLSGLVLALQTLGETVILGRASVGDLRRARETAIHGAVHHAAVLAWASALDGVHGSLDGLVWVAICCAVGVLVALLHHGAVAALERALDESATSARGDP